MIPIPWIATLQRAALIVRQTVRGWNRTRIMHRRARRRTGYAEWVRKYDTLDDESRRSLRSRMQRMECRPALIVVMRVSLLERDVVAEAVAAVRQQIYPHWALRLWPEDPHSPELLRLLEGLTRDDERIALAQGLEVVAESDDAWLVLTRARSVLAEHALLRLAEAIQNPVQTPAVRLIYADEDRLDALRQRVHPYFKPQWNEDLACSQDLAGDLLALHARCWRAGASIAPDRMCAHALALRCAEDCEPEQILHLPQVLTHRQALSPGQAQALTQACDRSSVEAVSAHLRRTARDAVVQSVGPGRLRVHWPVPDPAPRVSILIPTRNQLGLLRQCIETLQALTDYPNREVIVIDNGSDEPSALAYIEALRHRPGHRVIRDERPFNFSALNNLAARQAEGELLLLLNNDIEVIEPAWLTEMVALACRPEVGAVGAKLLYPNRTVQHAGFILGWGPHGLLEGGHVFKGLRADDGGHGDRALLTQSWLAVTGACLMLRKSLFDELGGLNELDLSVAFNDVDLCLRLHAQGYTNLCTPHAVLIHHESISRGRDGSGSDAKAERYRRELAWMSQRWSGVFSQDPFTHPNLSLGQEDFACADPPLVPPLADGPFDPLPKQRFGTHPSTRLATLGPSAASTRFGVSK